MKKLAILLGLLICTLTGPAFAGDCFIKSRIALVADGATEGKPQVFVIALNNGDIWQVHPDNVDIARSSFGGTKEGHYVSVCRSMLSGLHMKNHNSGTSFVVFNWGG